MKRISGGIEYELTRKAVKNLNLRLRPDGSVAFPDGSRWLKPTALWSNMPLGSGRPGSGWTIAPATCSCRKDMPMGTCSGCLAPHTGCSWAPPARSPYGRDSSSCPRPLRFLHGIPSCSAGWPVSWNRWWPGRSTGCSPRWPNSVPDSRERSSCGGWSPAGAAAIPPPVRCISASGWLISHQKPSKESWLTNWPTWLFPTTLPPFIRLYSAFFLIIHTGRQCSVRRSTLRQRSPHETL